MRLRVDTTTRKGVVGKKGVQGVMRNLKWGLVFGVLAVVLAVGTALALQPQVNPAKKGATCSNDVAAGTWGYTVTGTLVPPTGAVPFAIVGRDTTNPDGTFTGTQTSNAGGTVGDEVTNGTWAANSDCTGTFTINVLDQSGNATRTAVWSTVFVDSQTEMRGVLKSLMVSGTRVPAVLTLSERKLFPDSGDQQ